MGFMDDLKESVKHARDESHKNNTENSSLPPDYEVQPQHNIDHQTVDNLHAHEPANSALKQKIGVGKMLFAVCFSIAAIALYNHMQSGDTKTNAWVDAAPKESMTSSVELPQTVSTQSNDISGNWYAIQNVTGECKEDEGPAALMKSLKTLGQPCQVIDDVVEGGKPVQVKLIINDGVESVQAIYYRGKERCQAAANKRQQDTDAELNKYK